MNCKRNNHDLRMDDSEKTLRAHDGRQLRTCELETQMCVHVLVETRTKRFSANKEERNGQKPTTRKKSNGEKSKRAKRN